MEKNVNTKKMQELIYEQFSNYQDFINACALKGYKPSMSSVKSWFGNNQDGARSPSIKYLPIIADVLNSSMEELLTNSSVSKNIKEHVSIRYFSDIKASAGSGIIAISENFEKINVSKNFISKILKIPVKSSYDIIKINGESMNPLLKNNDFVVIDRDRNTLETIKNGDTIIFRKSDDLYCKTIQKRPFEKSIILLSENKEFNDILVKDDEFAQCEIIGVVVSKMSVETFKNFIELINPAKENLRLVGE